MHRQNGTTFGWIWKNTMVACIAGSGGEERKKQLMEIESMGMQMENEQSFKQMTWRMSNELHDELKMIAQQTGLTVTSVLLVAIWKNVLGTKHLPL